MSSSEPDIPAAPEQLGTEVFDANGRLSYSIVKENGKMVYRPGIATAQEQAEASGLKALQQQTLGRLAKTPEEYTRSAQEAADARTSSIMTDVNKQAALGQRNISEAMSAKGMAGSRMMGDTAASLEEQRIGKAAQVGAESTSMRDALVQQRLQNDVGLYNLYKSTNDASWAKMMGQAQFAGSQNMGQRSLDLQQWGQASQNAMNQWNAEQANDPWNKYISPTLSTGMMAYGMKK